MRARGWVLVAGALAVAAGDPGWARGEGVPARRVVGTVQVHGPVETRHGTGEWRPLTAGALLERTDVRTGPAGRTVLELQNGDVVALGGASSLRIADGATRLTLENGRLAVRFQPSSSLVVDTPSARIALPGLRRVAVTGLPEALVTLDNGTTTVRSFRGEVEATRAGAEPIVVADNQSVTLGQPDAGAPPAPAAAEDTKDKDMWAALGIPPGLAAMVGGALAIGGGVGGAAAAGAFDSDSSTAADKTPDQGSPFRPIKP